MPDEKVAAAAAVNDGQEDAAAAVNDETTTAAPAADVPVSIYTIMLDIYQRLGIVEAQNARIIDGQAEASDGRRRLYQEFGALREVLRDDGQEIRDQVAEVRTKVAVLSVRIDRIDNQVGELVPLVKGAEERRRRLSDLVAWIGASITKFGKLGYWLLATIGGALAFMLGDRLIERVIELWRVLKGG